MSDEECWTEGEPSVAPDNARNVRREKVIVRHSAVADLLNNRVHDRGTVYRKHVRTRRLREQACNVPNTLESIDQSDPAPAAGACNLAADKTVASVLKFGIDTPLIPS